MRHAYYVTVMRDDGKVDVMSGAFTSLNEAQAALKSARPRGVPKHRVRVLSASVLMEMGVSLTPRSLSLDSGEETVP